MTTAEVMNYITLEFQKGLSKEQVKSNLLAVGWSNSDIEESFQKISPTTPPNLKSGNKIGFLKHVGLLILSGAISSFILSAIAINRGYLSALAWICGDAPCNKEVPYFIALILISWIFTFSIPGISLYSIIKRKWATPIIFLFLSSPLAFYGIIRDPISILNFYKNGIDGSILSSYPQLITLTVYSVILVSLFILERMNIVSKLIKGVLATLLVLISIFVLISIIYPKLLYTLERSLVSAKIGSNLTKTPTGIIFFASFQDPDNPGYENGMDFNSINSQGEMKKYNRPENCGVADITPYAALCVKSQRGRFHKIYYLNLQDNSNKLIDFREINLEKVSDLKLSKDGKILVGTETGRRSDDYVTPKLFMIDIDTGNLKVLFEGNDTNHQIITLTISNDGKLIAFSYGTLNQYRYVGEASIIIVDVQGNKMAEFNRGKNYPSLLKFSDNGSKIFYYTAESKSDEHFYNLIDIQNGKENQASTKGRHQYNSSLCGEYGEFAGELFDGKDFVYFATSDGKVQKINITTVQITEVIELKSSIDCIYLGGKYAITRNEKAGNSFITFIIDLKDGKKSKLLDHSEFVREWLE